MIPTKAIDELYSFSPSLADHLPGIDRAAATDSPILILGEPGSGRSSLARALHYSSPRRDGPLRDLDVGTVPAALFESELFGYRPGAFTGAEAAEDGRVAGADGGTLVLDHVEELPLSIQPKLLRLLAERRFAPLGGGERSADVRFLAIGAEDLPERVRRGAFRDDLFYRLEVLAFRLPPLRERRADVAAMSSHLLAELATRFERPVPRLSDRALAWMKEYRWPGNIRQLKNLLERALIMATKAELDPEPPRDVDEPRPRPLSTVEHEEILRALAYTRGHQGRAAAILGISRKALWEKRRRFGIP